MYIISNDGIIDCDMDLLVHVVTVLDEQLDRIPERSVEIPDADALGLYDRAEHITGLGFAACQAYMAATYGFIRFSKKVALQLGPGHGPSGRFVADVVNHAANFWKHHSEWPFHKDVVREQAVRGAFNDLGFSVDMDYPLNGILAELAAPDDARIPGTCEQAHDLERCASSPANVRRTLRRKTLLGGGGWAYNRRRRRGIGPVAGGCLEIRWRRRVDLSGGFAAG